MHFVVHGLLQCRTDFTSDLAGVTYLGGAGRRGGAVLAHSQPAFHSPRGGKTRGNVPMAGTLRFDRQEQAMRAAHLGH